MKILLTSDIHCVINSNNIDSILLFLSEKMQTISTENLIKLLLEKKSIIPVFVQDKELLLFELGQKINIEDEYYIYNNEAKLIPEIIQEKYNIHKLNMMEESDLNINNKRKSKLQNKDVKSYINESKTSKVETENSKIKKKVGRPKKIKELTPLKESEVI